MIKVLCALILLFSFTLFSLAQTSSYIAMPRSVKIAEINQEVKVQIIFQNTKPEYFIFGREGEKGVLEWAVTKDKNFSDVTLDTKPYFFELAGTNTTYIILRGRKLGRMRIGYSDSRYPRVIRYMTVTVMQSNVGFTGVYNSDSKKVFKENAEFTKPKSMNIFGDFKPGTDTFLLKISADKTFTCQVKANNKPALQMQDKHGKLLHQWLFSAPVDSIQVTTNTSAAFSRTKSVKLSLSLDKKSATYNFTNMKNKSYTLVYTGATVPAQNNWIALTGQKSDSASAYFSNGAFFTDTPFALKYYEFESKDSARVVNDTIEIQADPSTLLCGTHVFNATVDTHAVKIFVPVYFYITKPDSHFARGELFKRATAVSKIKALYFLPHSKISLGKALKERKLAIKDAKKKRGTTFHADSEISFNGSIVLYNKKALSTENKKATYASLLKDKNALFGAPCGVTLIIDDKKVDTQYMTVAITRPILSSIDSCMVYTGKKVPDSTSKTVSAFVAKGLHFGSKPSFGVQYTIKDRRGNPVVKTIKLGIIKATYVQTSQSNAMFPVIPQMNTVYFKMPKPLPVTAENICFYVNNQASIDALFDTEKRVPIKPL